MVLSKQVAYQYAKKYENTLKLLNAMNFSDMKILTPELNIYDDMMQFYDPNTNEIHLGSEGIRQIFSPEDKEEMYNALLYIQGHEEQHRRSTANVPYARAIHRGMQAVVRYIASVEDPGKRFRAEKDYADYVNFELRDKGIVLNIGQLQSIVQHVANALEDGRIERIRSSRLPGFALLRRYFRGKFWIAMEEENKPYAELSDIEKLYKLLDEILSLATCQLFRKGFVKAYATTPLMDDVNRMMPYIARGIMAGSVRKEEPEIIGLCEALAPFIYKAIRLSAKDVKEMKTFEEMLKKLIASMIDELSKGGPDERDEDTDEGSADSTFEHSDLEITLPDEVYDKLKEKKEGKKGGIRIKREHASDKADTDDKESEADKENKSNPSGTPSKDVQDDANNEGSDTNSTNKNTASSINEDADDKERVDEHDPDALNHSDKDTNELSKRAKRDKEWKSRVGEHNRTSTTPNGSDKDQAIQSVLDAIKEAGEHAHETAKDEIGTINERKGHEAKMTAEKKDTAPPITDSEMRDAMDGRFSFVEVKRSYQVDTDMPPVVAARGKTLHKKMEKYFRSLRSPNIRNLDSGGIDPSRIYGLAMKETDIFRKRGKDKLFDGCAYILIDNSGSMWGPKFTAALTAAAIIEEGFRGLFPIKIVSFNDDYNHVIHQVVKGWDESLRKNCSWNYRVHSKPGGGNADGCSIAVATKELSRRHEKKKLLVVLSDGAPTEGGSDPVLLTEQAIAKARKKGITVCGIYFETGDIDLNGYAKTFKDIYKRDYIAVPSSELDRNLTRVFEKFSRS